jgi:Zn-dependent M28 family amino/carboxypeptidase
MHRKKAAQIALIFALFRGPAESSAAGTEPVFSGAQALEYARRMVSFGARPAGSPELRKLQTWMLGELKAFRCTVVEDDFTASTPLGPKAMKNVIARFPGNSGKAIAITGHYDTKMIPGIHFVGANDGGASGGLLMALAAALSGRPRKDDVYLVWFDGEEAFAQWSETDGIYGSRHLAAKWAAESVLPRIKALINVDMIGDRDLDILTELNSSPSLRKLVWDVAARLGFKKHFLDLGGAVEDDHVPFVRRGVNSLDLIDFNYGPGNSYWHSDRDTIDKLSAESLRVVGTVLLESIRELEK